MSADFKFSSRSLRMLDMVHPQLILVVSRALLYSDVDFAVIEGMRSRTRQRQLVADGKSRTYNSKHLRHPDGYSHAIDVMATGDLNKDGVVDHQDASIAWNREWYGQISKAFYKAADELGAKVRWGGDFKSFFDGPHFELLET